MEFKSISIKSFISDLPRVFNENFSKLAEFINSKYDAVKNKLYNLTDIEITGVMKSNTVIAKNIKASDIFLVDKNDIINLRQVINNLDNIPADLTEIKERLNTLESKVEKLERIVALYVKINQ